MDLLKVFLVLSMFWWRKVVFARPPARRTRALNDCKTVAKFKQDYSNNLQDMVENMHKLFIDVVKSKPTQPTISFPASYLVAIKTATKTMESLDAYFKEMDKYTAYLHSSGAISVKHGKVLQAIKDVGTSVDNYCNCPSGKQYFVSTTPSTPVKTLSQQDRQFVYYKISTSLQDIFKHSSKNPIQC